MRLKTTLLAIAGMMTSVLASTPVLNVSSEDIAKIDVKEWRGLAVVCRDRGGLLCITINPVGKSKKVTPRETIIPAIIIQPKVLTGSRSQSNSDPKPAIVVNAANRQGVTIKRTVFRIRFRFSAPGF